MSEIEILKQQILALEKLIEIKNQTISELEKSKKEVYIDRGYTPGLPWTTGIHTGCVDGHILHDYPSPWMATIPPNCKRCGKQASNWAITLCTNGTSKTV